MLRQQKTAASLAKDRGLAAASRQAKAKRKSNASQTQAGARWRSPREVRIELRTSECHFRTLNHWAMLCTVGKCHWLIDKATGCLCFAMLRSLWVRTLV